MSNFGYSQPKSHVSTPQSGAIRSENEHLRSENKLFSERVEVLQQFAGGVSDLLGLPCDESAGELRTLLSEARNLFQELEDELDRPVEQENQHTIKSNAWTETESLETSELISGQPFSQFVEVFSLEGTRQPAPLGGTSKSLKTQTFEISPNDLIFSNYSDLACTHGGLAVSNARATAIQNPLATELERPLNISQLRHSALMSARDSAKVINLEHNTDEIEATDGQLVDLLRYYISTGKHIVDCTKTAAARAAVVLRFLPECELLLLNGTETTEKVEIHTPEQLAVLADCPPSGFRGFIAKYGGKQLVYSIGRPYNQPQSALEDCVFIQ